MTDEELKTKVDEANNTLMTLNDEIYELFDINDLEEMSMKASTVSEQLKISIEYLSDRENQIKDLRGKIKEFLVIIEELEKNDEIE